MQPHKLTRYDIIISTGHEKEADLERFIQKCIWSRKPRYQTAYSFIHFGVTDEYTIYSADLTQEDLLFLTLTFNGIARAVVQDFGRSNDATFKLAFGGEPYYHSLEARMNRALEKYKMLLNEN